LPEFYKEIGDAVYLKAEEKSKIPVRYFASFPYIDVLEQNTQPGFGQLKFCVARCFLTFIGI